MKESRPYVRWWWFADKILQEDIDRQMRWFAEQGFGGVEIAWVYPWPPGAECQFAPRIFSDEWVHAVRYAVKAAEAYQMGADLTYGTLWPFGGSFVDEAHGSMNWDGESPQRLGRSWELAHGAQPGRIVNHLDHKALAAYDQIVGTALESSLTGAKRQEISPAIFADSWEVHPHKLWSRPLGDLAAQWYGWDRSSPPSDVISDAQQRYRYREALGEIVLREFYVPFSELCRSRGALSRVQAHGAPTDLLRAYASADIPESEAVLFDPSFSHIAASAAAAAGRPIVSAEACTCLYGWEPYPGPGPFQGREDPSDLLLCVQALTASGVNHIIWHGAPYQTREEARSFYASVHIAPDGSLAPAMSELNSMTEKLCSAMRRGKPGSDIAVYLPLEDRWMAHRLDEAQLRPSAEYHWELHYEVFPEFLKGYQPMWVSGFQLHESLQIHSDGTFLAGNAHFSALVLSGISWVSQRGAEVLLRLADGGIPIFTDTVPRTAGGDPNTSRNQQLDRKLEKNLLPSSNISECFPLQTVKPWVVCSHGDPLFRVRNEPWRNTYLFAPPEARDIHYPMEYRQSHSCQKHRYELLLRSPSHMQVSCEIILEPGSSVIAEVDESGRTDIRTLKNPFTKQ